MPRPSEQSLIVKQGAIAMSDFVVIVRPAEAKCRRDEAEAPGYAACCTDTSRIATPFLTI